MNMKTDADVSKMTEQDKQQSQYGLADELLGGDPIADEVKPDKEGETDDKVGDEDVKENKGEKTSGSDENKDGEGGEALPGEEENLEKKGEDPKGDEGEKGKDEDLYEIPDDIKNERTRGRMENMVTSLKEKDTQLEEKDGQLAERDTMIQGFQELVESTGTSADEFTNGIRIMRMMKEDPAAASKELIKMAGTLAKASGVEIPGVDVLDDYDDLKQQVDDLKITREAAVEIAHSRNSKAANEKAVATKDRENTVTQEDQGIRQEAINKMTTFFTEKEKDIDYAKKHPHMLEAAAYAAQNLTPNQWAGYMEREYASITNIMKTTGGKTKTETPLGGTGSRGAAKVATTPEELADQML